jgi:metal-dependent amidase/aminoacylase/carboxypeptidase family protein
LTGAAWEGQLLAQVPIPAIQGPAHGRNLLNSVALFAQHADLFQHAHEVVEEILFHDLTPLVPVGNGAEVDVEFLVRRLNKVRFYDRVPVSVSDPALVKRMLPTVERAVGKSNVTLSPPAMAADDFAYFGQTAPAFFFTLGTQKPGTTSGINHASSFLADDSSIAVGMRAMTQVLVEYLQTTATR